MPDIDKRFALIRNGQPWYAVRIQAKGETTPPTYRISMRGESRDAHKQAETFTDIKSVAKKGLFEGKRMRCAKEGGPASSLDIKNTNVQRYYLDHHIAKHLGIPSEENVSELVAITSIL